MAAKKIVFCSNKGGVGKTFIAVNTATALALTKNRVLLLELNLQSGHDIDKMLNLPCRYGLINLFSQLDTTIKPELIQKATVKHSSGLDFLPAIINTNQISRLSQEKINNFFESASAIYDHIIIDAPKGFSEASMSALLNANLVLLVATPDDLSLLKLQWCQDMFTSMQIPKNMIHLVLNRSGSKGALSAQEVKDQLDLNILAQIPSDGRTVGLALNRGVPCVMDNSHSQVSRAIIGLAQELTRDDIFMDLSERTEVKVSTHGKGPGEFWKKIGLSRSSKEQSIQLDLDDAEIKLKQEIHDRLRKEMNAEDLSPEVLDDPKKATEIREHAAKIVNELLIVAKNDLAHNDQERERLSRQIVSEAFGLGALEDYLDDGEISDIMVNSRTQVFIEKRGKLLRTDAKFVSEGQMRAIIDRIIAPLGRRIDESVPMVDARLRDGSRFNAIIPPLSLTGPVITIRKFGRERPTIDDLLSKYNSLNVDMSNFLEACVTARKNIIVSGGTGSGKTTLLNIVSAFIPDKERIITIEDAAELRINQRHWLRLESRPANVEGKGRIPIRTLFINSLHMRPDRIIVGECRGPEVLDMLQAMNTGHDGSMTTLHANSTKDVLVRMGSMILLAGVDLPVRAINEMISTALDVIVHVNRFADGTRKIVEITEVVGLNEDHYLDLKDIFVFNQKGTDVDGTILGDYEATGYVPKCYEEFETMGIPIDKKIFQPPGK